MKLTRMIHTAVRRPKPWPVPGHQAIRAITDGPPLAVVVIAYRMTHQLANTIRSLLPPVQQDAPVDQYEIHVVDNGSPEALAPEIWNQAANVRYRHVPAGAAPVNPGVAINRAVADTRSPLVCVMIDGARMVTPGVIRWGIDLATLSPKTVVEVRGWHLGPALQNISVGNGYNSDVERKLLDSILWPADGYRLFEIGVPAASTAGGFLGTASECTCLFLSRAYFDQLAGYDERYAEPGGGLCNADFFVRAVKGADRVFTLLGEGTFHQIHGGAATGLTGEDHRTSFRRYRDEYERLSRPWHKTPVRYSPILAGHLPAPARRWLTSTLA
jgi:hypothetical protein